MEYRIEFDDGCVLTFEETTQRGALGFVSDHAQPDQEFTMKSRRTHATVSGKRIPISRTPWDAITKISYWKVNWPGCPANCKRVR